MAKFALRTGATFATVSKAGQEKLINDARIPEQKIIVIRNGVDATKYQPPTLQQKNDARQSLELSNGEFVVGCVGSLTPVKNQQLLISAFADIIEAGYLAKLLIVGNGPLRKNLEEFAHQIGIDQQVLFFGESSNVISCLHAMDVYVCSSDSECLSNSLLEAMSSGLPIISTDVGDHAWVLSNNNGGIVVPSGNTKALATAITRVYANETYRQALGNQAQVRASSFDVQDTIAAYERYYTSISQRNHATPAMHLDKSLIEPATMGPVIGQSRAKADTL